MHHQSPTARSFGWAHRSTRRPVGAPRFSRVHRLDQKGICEKQLDEDVIERYWHYFEHRKRVRSFDVGALARLLDLLREYGITPQRTIGAVPTAREMLIEKYRCYLRME